MAHSRKQAFHPSPAHASAKDEEQLRLAADVAGFEQRLATLCALNLHDDAALLAAFAALAEEQWRTARIVAIRCLGATRARAVCDRAFGVNGGRIGPAVAELLWQAEERHSPPWLAWEQARAQGLADVLEMLAGDGEHADPELASEVFAGAGRPVATAARALARSRLPAAASSRSPLTPAGSDPWSWHGTLVAPRADAMLKAGDRRAATLFRRQAEGSGQEPDPEHPLVHEALRSVGSGQALPQALRAELEAELGAGFSHVRIHVDAVADGAARAVHARAFTVGEDIFFAHGQFAPQGEGRRLLVHELTHVLQGRRGAIPSSPSQRAVSHASDPLEIEAEQVASRSAGGPVAPSAGMDAASLAAASIEAAGTEEENEAASPAAPSGTILRQAASGAAGGSKAAAKPTVPPSRAPSPNRQRAPVAPVPTPAGANATPSPAPAPPARRPAATAAPAASPAAASPTAAAPSAAAPTPAPAAAGPGTASGAAVTATGDFAAQIRAIAARQKQELTAKSATVKAELVASIVAEKAKLIAGFAQTLTKMQSDRDQALSQLTTHAETSRTQVRTAAQQEHAKLDEALARQQQTVRTTGETLATHALTQGAQQGDRVLQGSQQRAANARAVGAKWAEQFTTLDGGAGTASDVRGKAEDLATKLLDGAADARQSCIDQSTQFAEDLRKDAADTAAKIPEKLGDSRQHIDDHQSDALKSIDDGVTNAHDGIGQSFDQSQKQVLDQQQGATEAYDQLTQGTSQQLDQGVEQLTAKLDPMAEQIATHAEQAEREGQQYAVSPEVTQTIHDRIAGVVNDRLGKLTSATTQAQGALDDTKAQGQSGAQQQTQTVMGQLDTVGSGMQSSLAGKVTATTGKLDESASSAVTNIATITPAADTAMSKVATQGQTKWTQQLTDNVTKLSGGIDDALAHQDSQVTKLDTDLGNQFNDAKAKQAKAGQEKSWWESAWDSVSSFMGDVFSFLGGLVVGFFEAAWELIKGIWDMLHSLWGILILIALIIIVVLVVIFFGWEVLLIAGIILGLCFAAYYVYLAVTTPGLSWYERGKLFGKALFNVVLGFAGVEFDWGELLNVAKWVPEAAELIQALGGIGKAIELVRALGGIGKAIEFLRAVGGAAKLAELAEAAGGIAKLVELAKAAGGIAKLMELIEAVGGVQKLVELAQAAGGIEKLVQLAEAAGGMQKLLELAQAVGGIDKLLELTQQAGGMAKLLELAQQAGGIDKLLELAQQVGGFDKLVELAKAAGGLDKLLELAQKAGGMAALAQIIKDVGGIDKLLAMIKEAGSFEDLLKLATEVGSWPTLTKMASKAGGIAALEALLNDAKIARNVKLLEELLDHPLIADGATLAKLLKHAKVVSGTEALELLKKVDSVERLLRMLDMGNVPSGTKLLEWLTKAGGGGAAARLEDMLNLAAAKGGSVQKMCDAAAGSESLFKQMADWADILKNVKPKPGYAPPPQVAKYGFNGADTAHFLDHTWDFVDINARVNKSTTFWPHGTTPQQIADELGQALDRLNPAGTSPHLPLPNNALVTGAVKVGSRVAGSGTEIGQFFPTAGETITKQAMRAIKALIKP